jgi:hypothetical protein
LTIAMNIQRPVYQKTNIAALSRSSAQSPVIKSYPERIAEVVARAPAVPPLRRKPAEARAPMSEDTRAKLIYAHAVQATYGGPRKDSLH